MNGWNDLSGRICFGSMRRVENGPFFPNQLLVFISIQLFLDSTVRIFDARTPNPESKPLIPNPYSYSGK